MRFQRWTIPFEFRLFRHLAGYACLLFLISCSAEAFGEWNLPQSTEKVLLPAPAQKVLETTLSEPVGAAPVLLSSESTAPIITSLPKGFRDSCNKIVQDWPTAAGTDRWTTRVLFSTHIEGGIEAVLALRCGSSHAEMKEWYDERPAVVVLTRESASLRLVPLEKECNDCERFYHVEFSKTYTAVGTRLVELKVTTQMTTLVVMGLTTKTETASWLSVYRLENRCSPRSFIPTKTVLLTRREPTPCGFAKLTLPTTMIQRIA
jgi:hypothetical protein